MRLLTRSLACLLVAVAAAAAIEVLCIEPYRCDAELRRAEAIIQRYGPIGGDLALIAAREELLRFDSCPRSLGPPSADQFMDRAGLLQLYGRDAEALREYRSALRYHCRPEIYLNIAVVQLRAADRDAALDSLTTAARYSPRILLSGDRNWGQWLPLQELYGLDDEVYRRLKTEDPSFVAPY